MPIKVEITGETPGSASLRIVGLGNTSTDGAEMRLYRPNSSTYLGADGQWYGEEKWLPLPPVMAEGTALVGQVGATVVDALAVLGPSDVVGMAVRTPETQQEGRIKTSRLYPSELEGDGSRSVIPPVVEIPTPAPEPEPEPVAEVPPETEAPETAPPQADAPIPEEPTTEAPASMGPTPEQIAAAEAARLALIEQQKGSTGGRILKVIGILLILGILGGIAFIIYSFVNSIEQAFDEIEGPAVTVEETTPSADVSGLSTRDDVAVYLAQQPDPQDALEKAQALQKDGLNDLALLVFKYAQRAGNTDAAMALARMYDPQTWSAETSPFAQPDAETATYWYEPAAEAGNIQAQRRLGEILTDLYGSGFQHNMGLQWLEKAAQAGDAQAQALLDRLK